MSGSPVDVVEIFSLGRLTGGATLFGLTPGAAYDLRLGWDLSDSQQRRRCRLDLVEQDPYFILGSPLCKSFSILQQFALDSPSYQETLRVGMQHLEFLMGVFQW
ncbi:MAG: hypothetical protein ACKPKO_26860, partial [Candidatus Fonsibacter sp.]